MRKLICSMLALALVLSAGIPTAFAHNGNHHSGCVREGNCPQMDAGPETCVFTDADGNGICDNCKNVCPNCPEGKDEDKDGNCDTCGSCPHASDSNGDGVCDNHGDHHGKPQGNGSGGSHKGGHHKENHHSKGHGHHH